MTKVQYTCMKMSYWNPLFYTFAPQKSNLRKATEVELEKKNSFISLSSIPEGNYEYHSFPSDSQLTKAGSSCL